MLHRVKEIVGFLHGRPEVVIYLSTTTRHADFCTNPVNVIPQILLQCAGEEEHLSLLLLVVGGGTGRTSAVRLSQEWERRSPTSQESGGSEAEATADAKLQVLTFHSELGWFLIIKKKNQS